MASWLDRVTAQVGRGSAVDEGVVVEMCFVDGDIGAVSVTTAARKNYTGDWLRSSRVSMKGKNNEAIGWRP